MGSGSGTSPHFYELFFDSGVRSNYYPDTAMRAQCHSTIRFQQAQGIVRGSVGVLLLALWFPVANATAIPHPHPQPRQIVHIIEKLERMWQQAELTGNTATMATMLSEDYLGIYGDGTLATKAETISSFKDGTTKFSQIHTWDRKIRVFGSTAVVVSKAQVAGTHDGDSLTGLYRYTRVYHRHNGVWQIVSFEASATHPHRQGHGPKDGKDGPENGPVGPPTPAVARAPTAPRQ
ncbi:MAG: nuclear transport factor 2 family protein [Acidobacteriaceae bacterium]